MPESERSPKWQEISPVLLCSCSVLLLTPTKVSPRALPPSNTPSLQRVKSILELRRGGGGDGDGVGYGGRRKGMRGETGPP